jgi:hypothetical protein
MIQTPSVSSLAKLAGGIAQQDHMPKFARQKFQSWFRRRTSRDQDGPRVLLWADTFHNYFHPAVAASATELLESAGYRVVVPTKRLCFAATMATNANGSPAGLPLVFLLEPDYGHGRAQDNTVPRISASSLLDLGPLPQLYRPDRRESRLCHP